MVLGFQYSVSLDEGVVEGGVEDEMSTGSISGPDDKPGPVFGSGGCNDKESGDGLIFSVLDVVEGGGVGGRFSDDALGGGVRDRFGGAAARRVVSS